MVVPKTDKLCAYPLQNVGFFSLQGDYEEEAYFKEAVLGREQREMYAEAGMVADQPADPSQNQL